MAALAKDERNMLNYIVVCVSEFAARHGLRPGDAYEYLRHYKGIDYLQEFYDVEHTLSFDDTISDLNTICKNNGGAIV